MGDFARAYLRLIVCRAPSTVALAAALFAGGALADDAELFTGQALRQVLAQPVEAVSWKGKSLRGSLERITDTQRVAVMLDRRVDPDQTIEFSATRIPLQTMIEQLAHKYGAGACHVGPVVYVGPPETTQLLATLAELRRDEIRELPAVTQRRLLRPTPWRWKRLATPRELLDELERDYDVTILGKEKMPHDLWPAMRMPPVDFATKLSLVLAGFHTTFRPTADGSAVQIIAMPMEASLSRRYTTGSRAASLAERLAKQFPQTNIRAQGRELIVDGHFEAHDAIARLLSGERVRPPAATGRKHYTLNVENKPVGGVIKALGGQLGKEVVFDVSVERRLAKEISLSVKEVSMEQLLSAVLTPAGLKYEIDGERLRVFD